MPNRNPAIRMTGKRKAQTQSTNVFAISLREARASLSGGYPFCFALKPTATIRKTVISRPGIIPAANSRPIDTSAILPYKTRPMPGGIIVVISELQPMTDAENPPE